MVRRGNSTNDAEGKVHGHAAPLSPPLFTINATGEKIQLGGPGGAGGVAPVLPWGDDPGGTPIEVGKQFVESVVSAQEARHGLASPPNIYAFLDQAGRFKVRLFSLFLFPLPFIIFLFLFLFFLFFFLFCFVGVR
jgi:hypothetical protein